MDRLSSVRLVLGTALLGLAVHLVVGEKPWEGDAAELLRQGKPVYFLDQARIYSWWISAAYGSLLAEIPLQVVTSSVVGPRKTA